MIRQAGRIFSINHINPLQMETGFRFFQVGGIIATPTDAYLLEVDTAGGTVDIDRFFR